MISCRAQGGMKTVGRSSRNCHERRNCFSVSSTLSSRGGEGERPAKEQAPREPRLGGSLLWGGVLDAQSGWSPGRPRNRSKEERRKVVSLSSGTLALQSLQPPNHFAQEFFSWCLRSWEEQQAKGPRLTAHRGERPLHPGACATPRQGHPEENWWDQDQGLETGRPRHLAQAVFLFVT